MRSPVAVCSGYLPLNGMPLALALPPLTFPAYAAWLYSPCVAAFATYSLVELFVAEMQIDNQVPGVCGRASGASWPLRWS